MVSESTMHKLFSYNLLCCIFFNTSGTYHHKQKFPICWKFLFLNKKCSIAYINKTRRSSFADQIMWKVLEWVAEVVVGNQIVDNSHKVS